MWKNYLKIYQLNIIKIKKETLQKKACESISEEEKPKKQQYVCERY